MMWTHFHWIEGPHRLAIMQCPSGGDRLERDIAELRACGVDVLVSMMEPAEAAECGLSEEAAVCRRHGVEFSSFPIRDHHTPDSPQAAIERAVELARRVRAGRGVVLHCFAGLGRSATMALVTMRVLGYTLTDAVQRLSRARGVRVPETEQQLRWVAQLEIETEPGEGGRPRSGSS